jgi:molybdopterin synthase catalytic subunit
VTLRSGEHESARARAWITTDPLSADSVLQLVGTDKDGAINVFLGVVRDHNDGQAVSGMHYDVYLEMAERTLRDIVAEAEALPGTGEVAAVHRVGELKIGEASVAIAAAAPHRSAAFEACRYVIEEIKKRLPVWKQERYITGETRWLAGEHASTQAREHEQHAG